MGLLTSAMAGRLAEDRQKWTAHVSFRNTATILYCRKQLSISGKRSGIVFATHKGMIRNFFLIAYRNLRRNKAFSAINIVGLAIGIATCLLILLFVGHELGYDRYNEKADQIVRVIFDANMPGGAIKEANVMPPVGPALKKDFPEVLAATRLRPYGRPRLSNGRQIFREDAFSFVGFQFFQVFTIPLLEGDAATALVQPNSIVITRAVARKYFGSGDAMGKTVVF